MKLPTKTELNKMNISQLNRLDSDLFKLKNEVLALLKQKYDEKFP